MADWEDFCESQGLDIQGGFDALMDRYSRDLRREERKESRPFFATFQEALNWSRDNNCATFTRSADGNGFMPSIRKARR